MMNTLLRLAAAGALSIALNQPATAADNPGIDIAAIEQTTGLKGKYSKEENVFKISKPRTDVKVEVDQWQLPPFMGLTSWAAFTPVHNHVMMMGDTVVFEDEVNPAMDAAFEAGLEVTALHNHFFFDKPKVYFMHIGGMGSEEQLAKGVRNVYDRIAAFRKEHPEPQQQFLGNIPSTSSISAEPLERILGLKGESKDGMWKMSVGRTSSMHGVKIGNAMGVNTWAAFAGTDDQAVVDGDFAMLKDEMQPILKTMRAGGINIVAIHQHMTEDDPHYFFMHYWGKGKAEDLAKVIKQALDKQSK
ncbi:DUF1259 domain-containing protein [Methylobacillus sp.]|uniref:DUF1259 domain-containing protein n=1 Tax=Methylobacillus sp. TaxID=56818 RepID=UPI002FDF3ED6